MTTVKWNVTCTIVCPECGEEKYLEIARTNEIYANAEGVEIHESEVLTDDDSQDLLRDDLISWLCTECGTLSGIEISSSWGTPYTVRKPKKHIEAEVSFLENMTPISLRVGVTNFLVEQVERHEPLYGKHEDLLFGKPPYGVWSLKLTRGRIQIEVGPAYKNLHEIKGDFLHFLVTGLDKWSNEALCDADKSDALRAKRWNFHEPEWQGSPLPHGLLASAAFNKIILTECNARQVIWRRLQASSVSQAPNWWKGILPRDLVDKISSRAQGAGDPQCEKHQLSDFITTAELRNLLNEKWEKVFASSGISLERINAAFIRFVDFRNQVAHGRSITYKEYLDTIDASDNLTKLLNGILA